MLILAHSICTLVCVAFGQVLLLHIVPYRLFIQDLVSEWVFQVGMRLTSDEAYG